MPDLPLHRHRVLLARIADRIGRKNLSFKLALFASLLLHLVVLSLKLAAPTGQADQAPRPPGARIDARLTAPRKPPAPAVPPTPKVEQRTRSHVLAMPQRSRAAQAQVAPPDLPERNWSQAERNEMDQFLNGLAEEAKPRSGLDLAQRALAMARTLRVPPSAESDESTKIMRKLLDAQVEPFSIEMYFNALFNKMNRSAAMLGNTPRAKGVKAAAVRIKLNRDGSVKSFEILRVADQQAEIDFIRAVVDMAAPFPVFPPDIRRATDALVLQICIRPDMWGNGSGAAFTRMGEGESCR